jgi:hypothetical protein
MLIAFLAIALFLGFILYSPLEKFSESGNPVDCIDIPITYGKSKYICKGKGILASCYAIGKNEGFPNGFANYVGSNSNFMCNNSPLCSDIAQQCGLSALRNL